MSTFDTVTKIISDKMDIDPEDIQETSTFESLSIDSLDMVEIVMDLEQEFDLQVDDTEDIKSVGELVKYIDTAQAEAVSGK